MLSTRVRIDMYSNVRAVIETTDGKLHMATKFVKASGDARPPPARTPTRRSPTSARCRSRTFEIRRRQEPTPPTREAQVMIRHPNFTGMQMDQLTREYHARQVRAGDGREAQRRAHLQVGGRHLDLGKPQLPLHLRRRRQMTPSRSRRRTPTVNVSPRLRPARPPSRQHPSKKKGTRYGALFLFTLASSALEAAKLRR